MDSEEAFKIVGSFGRFQILTTFICFLANIFLSLQMVLMVVVGATPNITRENEQNLTTVVTEFGLYDKSWITGLMQSLFMAGFMLGCFAFGQLSDIIGRKPVMVVSEVLSGIIGIFSGFVTTWETFVASRILAGIFIGGLGTTNFVIMTELIGRGNWVTIGVIYQCFFSIGIILLSLIALVSKQWRIVCYVSGGFGLLILPLFYYLPESPRWLYSVGRTKKAEKVFKYLGQKNGLPKDQEIHLTPLVIDDNNQTNNFIDIFRHAKLAIWMVVMGYVWFTCALVYYGLTLSAADLTSDLYIGIILSGAIEIPANLCCILLLKLKWLGRKGTLMLLFFICGASSLASIFLEGNSSAKLGLGLTSKLSITASFAMIYIYTAEMFPTTIRNVAVSASATVARLGAILASFVTLLANALESGPYIVFCSTTLLGFLVVVLLLPETYGKPLPRTIEDVIEGPSRYQHQVNDWDTDSSFSQEISEPGDKEED